MRDTYQRTADGEYHEDVVAGAQGATDSERRATDSRHDCPLCARSAATRSDVYGHLLVEHRKSAITAELLGHDRSGSEAEDCDEEGRVAVESLD